MAGMVSYQSLFIGLAQHKIQYLVAGGFAVNFHQVQRATMDLDLIVFLEENNVKKFILFVESLGFKPRLPVNPADIADPKKRESWIQEKGMVVFSFYHPENPFETIDMFVQEPKPFAELYQNRFVVKAFGAEIPVLGLKDLIEIKRAAGRDKDLFDISQLEKKFK